MFKEAAAGCSGSGPFIPYHSPTKDSTMVNTVSGIMFPLVCLSQDSILGPLLFIFANDISSVTESKLKIFADAVALFTSVKCKEDCLSLQVDLDAIILSRWCQLWQMKLHPFKCEVLCISMSNKRFPQKINDVCSNGIPLLDIWVFISYLGMITVLLIQPRLQEP